MKVRPFRLLGNADLAKIEQIVVDALRAWAQEWELNASALSVSCMRAWEANVNWDSLTWQPACYADDRNIWHGTSPELQRDLQDLLFPPDPEDAHRMFSSSSIAPRMAEQAVIALQNDLSTAMLQASPVQRPVQVPADEVWQVASGAAAVLIELGESRAVIILSHACVGALAPPPISRQTVFSVGSRLEATRAVPVTLPVALGGAQVDLESLMSLAIGDVIRLETTIDQPLNVQGPDGNPLFGAHLGRVDRSVAIEVVRLQQSTTGAKK